MFYIYNIFIIYFSFTLVLYLCFGLPPKEDKLYEKTHTYFYVYRKNPGYTTQFFSFSTSLTV